jgi:hypothetical protein
MTIAPSGFDGPNVNPGDIIVCDRGNSGADQIWVFSPDSAQGERLLTPDPGSVDWFDITSDPEKDVWVIDSFQSDSIFAVLPTGALRGIALSSPLVDMRSIVYDHATARLYVSAGGPQAVYSIRPATGEVALIADGFTNLGYGALAVGLGPRRLWVSDVGHDRVYEICLPFATAVQDRPPAASSLAMRVVPNPFNPSTNILFELREPATVDLVVYDALGRRVRTLAAREFIAGSHRVIWDGRDRRGQQAASGVYFARLRADDVVESRKMVLLK